MTRFTQHTPETAPPASRPILEQTERGLGFIPNLYATFAGSPAALAAYTQVTAALAKASLSPVKVHLAAIAISVENDCGYCVAAHSTLARAVKAPEHAIEAARKGQPIDDPELEAVRSLAVDLVRERGWLSEARLQRFYDAGHGPADVLDLVTVAALKTLSNYTNHLAGVPLDAAFAPQAWERAA